MSEMIKYEWKKIWKSRLAQLVIIGCGLFLVFCVWLHEYKLRLGIDSFLFLSRDGQIMRAAYKILYP